MVFGRINDNVAMASPTDVPGTEVPSQSPILGTGVEDASRPSTQSQMGTEQVGEVRDEIHGKPRRRRRATRRKRARLQGGMGGVTVRFA